MERVTVRCLHILLRVRYSRQREYFNCAGCERYRKRGGGCEWDRNKEKEGEVVNGIEIKKKRGRL